MQTCCTRVARAVQSTGEENRKRTSRKHTCHKLKLTVMSRGDSEVPTAMVVTLESTCPRRRPGRGRGVGVTSQVTSQPQLSSTTPTTHTTRVGALVAHHPAWMSTPPRWVPARDTHGTLGSLRREAVGGSNSHRPTTSTRHMRNHERRRNDKIYRPLVHDRASNTKFPPVPLAWRQT